VVIDRVGKPEIAQKAADYIKCKQVRTEIVPGMDENTDVTIIIGEGFRWQIR